MLRLSKLTDYSTVILAQMARQPDEVQSVAGLAAALGLAPPTASKVLKTLTRHGLVKSRRGSMGGYLLARPPAQISIADVVDAMEGRFGLTECSVASGLCAQEDSCGIRTQWQGLNGIVRQALNRVTLSDMAPTSLTAPAVPLAPPRSAATATWQNDARKG
jgi:FeS assembly SUF system regulator